MNRLIQALQRPRSRSSRRIVQGLSSADPIKFHIDTFDQTLVNGWAVHHSGIREIRVLRDGLAIGNAALNLERPDVHRYFPEIAGSDRSGFSFQMANHLSEGSNQISVEIISGNGESARASMEIAKLGPLGRHPAQGFRAGVDLPIRSGFPFELTDLLRAYRPGSYEAGSSWTDEMMVQAVSDLKVLWQSGTRSSALTRYILFLKTMYHRFRWISTGFPKFNDRSALDAKDSRGILTSPPEMLAIANQLYVLKSNGLDGHFLEFGCFKGYSSCCLSYCCHHLGLPMEIFDSFEGLPASDSDFYSAGDFCGTLEEVSANLEEFGEPRVVTLHKGYFEETLPQLDRLPVICIWMDVDLFSSAQDVAQIFDWLPRSSAVFTHEFPADSVQGGRIIPHKSEVFPPILDRLVALWRSPVGRYLDQALGAIWDESEGIPVLPQDCLMELVKFGE